MPEIARAIRKLERVGRILYRLLLGLGCAFILLHYLVAAKAPTGPSLRDGRVYPHRYTLPFVLTQYRRVVYLTKNEDLLFDGPVEYVLLATVASIGIIVGYKLRKLEKRRDEANRTASGTPPLPDVRSATRRESI
jgi:hypothetical protein